VKASQRARPVLVPRNITPVGTALSIPQSGPDPSPGNAVIPSAPDQPRSGRACQRLNPPLTTYEKWPGRGEAAASVGQIRIPIFLAASALLLGRSAGSGTPPTV